MFLVHFDVFCDLYVYRATAPWNLFILLYLTKKENFLMVMSPGYAFFPPIDHYKHIKEPIKMHVEFSLLYKTLLIIEMRSKVLKAKGSAVQVLNTIDILSMTKVKDNRKLCLISFLF